MLDGAALRGLADTLAVVRQVAGTIDEASRPPALAALGELTASPPVNPSGNHRAPPLGSTAREGTGADVLHRRGRSARLLAPAGGKQVEAWNGIIDRYLRPLEILRRVAARS